MESCVTAPAGSPIAPPTAAAVLDDRRPGHAPGLVERSAIALVYAATLYPLVLCFLTTKVSRLTNTALILAEVLIGLASFPILVSRLNLALLLLCITLCANFVILAMVQQAADFKALRDLLLPVVFVWLGYLLANRHRAERALRNLAVIATVLGLVEFIFPTFYTSLFDAAAFYLSRGFASNNPLAVSVLSLRPTGIGRSLLPFLGPRRMSSIFLEPVSFGNFAVLTAAWAISKPRAEWREASGLMLLAVAMLVMSDARFGSATVLLLLGARATGLWRLRILSGLLPVLAMTALVLVTYFGPPEFHDNMIGRMQVSGRNLISLPWEAWLGIPANISLDAGYGYIIQRTGLVICTLLWLVFAIVPLKDDQARRFHFSVAVYASLNLCISGSSLFSLKTTAIAWLLLGTVIAHRPLFAPIRAWRMPDLTVRHHAVT